QAEAVRVLFIEKCETSAAPVLASLAASVRAAFDIARVDGVPEAQRRCMSQTFDLILVGAALEAPEDLEPFRALAVSAPLVLLADLPSAPIAHHAVVKGTAQDYLVKGHLDGALLEQALLYAIERHKMLAVLKQRRRDDPGAQNVDRLTQLPNRAAFYDRLGDLLQTARQNSQMASVMLINLEGFKLVHNTLGPAIGDPLLQQIAARLRGSLDGLLRDRDLVARLSGEEFAIVLGDLPQMKDVSRAAELILAAFAQPFVLNAHEFFISPTIGISMYPFDGADAESMIHGADIALRRAREQGSDCYQFFLPAVNHQFLTRLELQNSLRIALARDEFVVHYMPQLDVKGGQIVSMEALVRWNHPTLGLVQPSDFIPLAEESGLILPLGERVLRAACAQSRAWQRAGLPPIRVSVNFSPRQFQHQNPVALVSRVLKETGLPPGHLELEITESAVMKDADAALGTLRALKETGVHLAIDDFGTGYSSLSYLRSFPITSLKVDRSFVKEVTSRSDDAAIVTAVIAMAHSLKLKVIAEGVETEQHLEWLHARDCDEVQGYHFSRPVPAEAAAKLLARSASRRN
ncbi:MAG: EAL domain-containing protein, partial [Planctomycetes bacterium]|nr:EAL domain-containing protein [Planctomycetota bacterium]